MISPSSPMMKWLMTEVADSPFCSARVIEIIPVLLGGGPRVGGVVHHDAVDGF